MKMLKNYQTEKNDIWLPYEFSVGPVMEKVYLGLKEGKILGNTCPECKKVLFPARTFCPECQVEMKDWVELSHEGEIITWTIANYSFFGEPVPPPYIIAMIRLDGSNCNFLHIVNYPDLKDFSSVNEKIGEGSRVRAVFNNEKNGHMMDIKYFELV
jgi:hypothetical protein